MKLERIKRALGLVDPPEEPPPMVVVGTHVVSRMTPNGPTQIAFTPATTSEEPEDWWAENGARL